MMNRQMARVLALAVLVFTAIAGLSASTQPSGEYYTVTLPSRTLANGMVQPARTFYITRPAPGTYIPGMISVKTRSNQGNVNGETLLGTSSINRTMKYAKISNISMFTGAGNVPNHSKADRAVDKIYKVQYDEPLEPYDMCKQLMADPDVEYAVPVQIHQLNFTPNDPKFGQQTFLNQIKVPEAWDVHKGSPTVLIAIIDSGIDWMHEDLADNIFGNNKEIAGNNKDDDNNGYVDDIRGWDFVGSVSYTQLMQSGPKPDNDPRVYATTFTDVQGHGTVVAGNAAATTNNKKGVAGVASNSLILPLKCGSDNPEVNGILGGYEAIRYAADMGASVINCSWGGLSQSPAEQEVIDYALGKNCVVVVAAGNDGQDLEVYKQSPATLDGVISVGSVSATDKPSSFSNYGWYNTTYAPGEYPISTFPGNDYKGMPGTSFSSPITAGVAALIRAQHPDWTPAMVAAQIRMTGDAIAGINANDKPKYFSRVNAFKALNTNKSWTAGERLPGLYVKSFSVPKGRIDNLDSVTVTIVIENALADVTGAKLQFVTRDKTVKCYTTNEIPLRDLPHGATDTVELKIQLDARYPWFEADVALGVSLKAGTIVNYQQMLIPVKLSSKNTFTQLFNQQAYVSYYKVAGTATGEVFAGGSYYSAPIVRGYPANAANQGFAQLNQMATAIAAFNATTAVVGGGAGSATGISYTANGQSYGRTSVSTFASGVSGIKFYTRDSVVFVGTGSGSKIAVGISTNTGVAWANTSSAPTQQVGETVPPNGVSFIDNNIFIVTSTGRVLRSTNRGQTWGNGTFVKSVANLVGISFRDANNGVIVYRDGVASTAPYKVASSTDGGRSWKDGVFNVTAGLGIVPVSISSPGKHHVLVSDRGFIYGSDDNGASWQVIYSKPAGVINGATTFNTSSGTTVALCGERVATLTYRYAGPNATKILTIVDKYDFGAVDSASVHNEYIVARSTGEGTVVVDSVWIVPEAGTPDSIFTLSVSLAGKSIDAGAQNSLRVRLNTKAPGTYKARINIKTNATGGESTTIDVSAIVKPAPVTVSVSEEYIQAMTLYPNPAGNHVSVGIPDGTTRIRLVDMAGREVYVSNGMLSGEYTVATDSLPQGVYYMIWETATGAYSRAMTIVR